MGATHNALCLRWQMSPGHLARVLAGTTRVEAGGPIQSGAVLPTLINGMTKEEIDLAAKISGDKVEALLKKQAEREMLPSMDYSERALNYGARVRPKRGLDLKAVQPTISRPVHHSDIPVTASGVPLPPDWKDFASEEETVVKQSDADQLLDELMKG